MLVDPGVYLYRVFWSLVPTSPFQYLSGPLPHHRGQTGRFCCHATNRTDKVPVPDDDFAGILEKNLIIWNFQPVERGIVDSIRLQICDNHWESWWSPGKGTSQTSFFPTCSKTHHSRWIYNHDIFQKCPSRVPPGSKQLCKKWGISSDGHFQVVC